ncbi:type I DNA topoisomerase, partial [bacterium]
MGKKVVIVESPTKSRTLGKYLGKDYKIVASMGHIVDLPEKQLAVDIKDGFKPRYQIIPGKKKVLNLIKKAVEGAEDVYLASDPDREGEAIAYHIARLLNILDNAHRVLFNEITKNAVVSGIENPTKIDLNKVYAQQARRILDRLVGYKVSPILWKILHKGLSAGRVQSVALKILAKREEELENFVPKEFWTIDQVFSIDGNEFPARVVQFCGEKLEIPDEKTAKKHLVDVKKSAPFKILEIERKRQRRNPPPPFITSSMQLEASRKLGFSAKKTMQIAQQLYEGVELGDEGPSGLITYMRTDSVRVADIARNAARKFIKAQFGENYVGKIRHGTKKSAQDAHEAIRPTFPSRTPEQVKSFLTKDQFKLYELIWRRFMASQMAPAELERISVKIVGGEYLSETSETKVLFDGFLRVWQVRVAQSEEEEKRKLPKIEEGDEVKLEAIDINQHFTIPPPRYSEGTLVKELESQG